MLSNIANNQELLKLDYSVLATLICHWTFG